MTNIPTHLKYTESHEWVNANEDGNALIGITDHAQAALGDLVFVELPAVGDEINQGDPVAVVESQHTSRITNSGRSAIYCGTTTADEGLTVGTILQDTLP